MNNKAGLHMNKWLSSLLATATLALLLPATALHAQGVAEIVCIQCHGNLPGKLGEPVRDWRRSIHAENAVYCNDCHGGDPKDAANAMSPARGFLGAPKEAAIPAFCGRCHVGVKKDYLQSAHGKALAKGGPTCVTCHGNHAVIKATIDLINETSCSRCHSYERAARMKQALQETEALIGTISGKIELFKGEGVDTDLLEKGLFSARNRYHTLFHDVDVARVTRESAQTRSELAKIMVSLTKLEVERTKRKIIGGVAVGGALLAALLFYLLRRTFD